MMRNSGSRSAPEARTGLGDFGEPSFEGPLLAYLKDHPEILEVKIPRVVFISR